MPTLAEGIPSVVIFPEFDEQIPALMDEYVARMDDSYWARRVDETFGWQRYLDWWIARRWVMPRDVRKQ